MEMKMQTKTQSPNSTWGPGELLTYEQECASRKVRDVPSSRHR